MIGFSTTLQRLRRALAYATGRLSPEESRRIIEDCRRRAGWHPLIVLSVDEALRHILETYVDHPSLRRFVSRACEDIERKCGGGALKDHDAAKEWASRLTRAYAREEGLILTRWEDVLPKRMFDRGDPAAERPASHPPGWRPTTADLQNQTEPLDFSFQGATRRLRGDEILAAALDHPDKRTAAE